MSITGIEKFTQRTRRLAFTACALAAVGTGTLLGSMPSTASAAQVGHSAMAKAQVVTSATKGHSSLPFGSKGLLRNLASGNSTSVTADVASVQDPDIECYATGYGGTIVAEPWEVNHDGRNTAYFAAIMQWNGSSWVFIGAAADDAGSQVQYFNDSVFGDLAAQQMQVTVNGHGLFRVVYVGQSTGDTGWTYALGDVVTPQTFADENTCEF
jgi:hypothetical protein